MLDAHKVRGLPLSFAISGANGAEVRALAATLGAKVHDLDRCAALSSAERAGAMPLLIDLSEADLDGPTSEAARAVRRLAAAGPVIAILDAHCVDLCAPFLDVSGLDLLVWPAGEDIVVRMLKSLDPSGLLSEYEGPDQFDLGKIRDELGRITEQLSRLVPGDARDAETKTSRGSAERAAAIRGMIRERRVRASFFPADLFADPAWDILLDLAAARHEGKPVSISSLCIAASVPTTTGLRWIKGMTEADLLERQPDPADARRSFITLSEMTARQMDAYLDAVG